MTNSEKLAGRFKPEIAFDIDMEKKRYVMDELDMREEEDLVETIQTLLETELGWLYDSGFCGISVNSIKKAEG